MGPNNQKRILMSVVFLLFAVYLGWLGFSYHNLPANLFHAPQWLFFLLSILLGTVSGLAVLGEDHASSNLLAALIWFMFAVVGAWAAFFSPLEELSGGSNLLSPGANRVLARIIFGIGAFANLGAGIYAGWRYIKGKL
jgi:hypothetical protein